MKLNIVFIFIHLALYVLFYFSQTVLFLLCCFNSKTSIMSVNMLIVLSLKKKKKTKGEKRWICVFIVHINYGHSGSGALSTLFGLQLLLVKKQRGSGISLFTNCWYSFWIFDVHLNNSLHFIVTGISYRVGGGGVMSVAT